jgi:hypothetical protein
VDPDKLFVDEMRSRIDAYFFIVLRNIRDSVPKIIGHFLVKACQEKLQYNLYNEINKNEQLLNTVGEVQLKNFPINTFSLLTSQLKEILFIKFLMFLIRPRES